MTRRIIMTKAGPYKMKFRPSLISRLARYDRAAWRLLMVGDPPVDIYTGSRNLWADQTQTIYDAMIAAKRGKVPQIQQTGLWYHL